MGKEVQGEIPIVRTETAKGLQQASGINVLKRILQNCCKQICKFAIFLAIIVILARTQGYEPRATMLPLALKTSF